MIPTDHIYLGVFANEGDLGQRVPIYAPGDITLTRLYSSETEWKDGSATRDYSIQFSPCRRLVLEYGHVTELSSDIQQAIGNARGNCREGKKPEGNRNTQCNYNLNYKVKAGEVVGYVTGKARGNVIMDFYTWNLNTQALDYANLKRYNEATLHAFCPLELYAGDLRDSLYQKLGGLDERRTVKPVCGEIMQDVKGTSQGNWFGVPDSEKDYGTDAIALVHENVDPAIAVISVGSGFYDPGKLSFRPKPSGRINRDFREITADGNVYCSQDELQMGGVHTISGKVLIQLVDDNHLRIEHQEGNCTGTEVFNSPYTYER